MHINDGDAPQSVSKPNPRNNVSMFQIFHNVQYNAVQHKKYAKEMTKLYKKMDEEAFRNSFSNALHYLFTFGDTSANVDRVIQFVATFCTSLDDEEEFLLFIFDIIFNCQCVSGQSVRYRASQLLAAVLAALGDDASLDDDLCDKLLESQMARLQDTRGAVRCRAALALQRLQNPLEDGDPVTDAYRFHMSCDPSSSVRRAVVMSIAKSIRNVPYVLERLCDVEEAVRRAAFLHVAAVSVTQLKVRQRVHILKVGLNERSPRVRRVVEEILVPAWLSSFNGNIIDLLRAIRLDNSQDATDSQYVAGKLLESLFRRLPTSELLEWLPTDKTLRLIPADKLSKETVWYWRHLAEHLQKKDDEETLESVLPDLVVLAGYIRAIIEAPCPSEEKDPVGFSTRQYVLAEMARLLRVYDVGDPVGRSTLQKLITDLLTGDHGPLSKEVIYAFVMALELVMPEFSSRVELVSSVISELREASEPEPVPEPPPLVESTETKIQRAQLRVSLNVAMEAEQEAVREQNYQLASRCKAKVEGIRRRLETLAAPPQPPPPPRPVTPTREKLSDSQTLRKCLLILNSALDSPQITTITPQLQLIFKELEVEIFKNPDILETALQTLALYAMLDKDFAKENKPTFFAHIVNTENEQLIEIILRCLMDILCVHGVSVFDAEEPAASGDADKRQSRTCHDATDASLDDATSDFSLTPTYNTVINLLLQFMDGAQPSCRLIVAVGLCRLMILGHLESPGILSRLLLLWFNPATEDEDMLRQTIGVFFQTFPVTVEGAQEQIQKATLPTLRALANAPANSPIAEIDQEAVVKFIVSLTKINHETVDSQGALAMLLLSHATSRPRAAELPLLSRILSLLAAPRDATVAADLARGLRDFIMNIPDKQSCRNLTRYLGALEAVERSTLNKISTVTSLNEASSAMEDLTLHTGRSTASFPHHPIARSTHVVIDDPVQEEVEIEDASPPAESQTNLESTPLSSGKDSISKTPSSDSNSSEVQMQNAGDNRDGEESASSGVSPVKKPRVNKKGRKKKASKPDSPAAKSPEVEEKSGQVTDKSGGIKRTRSQRSLVGVDPAPEIQRPSEDPDFANVTFRRSTRGGRAASSPEVAPLNQDNIKQTKSGKKNAPTKGKKVNKKTTKEPAVVTPARVTRSSSGRSSTRSPGFDDSSDETILHTIVYDKEMEQSLLDDSSDSEANTSRGSDRRRNVTIPETPTDSSDDSED